MSSPAGSPPSPHSSCGGDATRFSEPSRCPTMPRSTTSSRCSPSRAPPRTLPRASPHSPPSANPSGRAGSGMIEPAETHYAQSGDLSIAYQVFGEGPIDVVFVSGFVTHQELAWDVPFFRAVYERLGSFARVITFDKRGTGLSERTLGFGSAEERMDDIRAVMDTAGCERAALVGISEGGPLTTLFAATYPERASALVLWGTFARVQLGPDYPIGVDPSLIEPFVEGLVTRWNTGKALRFFISNIA